MQWSRNFSKVRFGKLQKMYVEQEGLPFDIPSCSVFKIKSEHLKRSLTGLDKCVANKMC